MRTKTDIIKDIQMILVGKFYDYSVEEVAAITKDYHKQTLETLLYMLANKKARLPVSPEKDNKDMPKRYTEEEQLARRKEDPAAIVGGSSRLKLSGKMLEIPRNSEVTIRVLPPTITSLLKRDIRERVQNILSILDSKDYTTECGRFGDVASEAEQIGVLINDCEAIDYEEDV